MQQEEIQQSNQDVSSSIKVIRQHAGITFLKWIHFTNTSMRDGIEADILVIRNTKTVLQI